MGTALCVIIPEGVNAIYESSHSSQNHHNHHIHDAEKTTIGSASSRTGDMNENKREPHSIVGITLLLGFVMMLIIDQLSSGISNTHYNQLPINVSDDVEDGHQHSRGINTRKSNSSITATIGLIVHSAADGIAMGAAATTSRADVEMIVFLAIMLHKAPASFGFVSFLLSEGLDRSRAKRHLLFLSLSAPTASFLTYFGISASAKEALSSYNATGISLLFSAGTFLYVAAVHVLPEVTQHQQLKCIELIYLITGSFLPPLLTFNHHH